MKHWFLTAALICFGSLAHSRELESCLKNARIEQRHARTDVAVEMFAFNNSSGTFLANRRSVELCNLDSTAANHVWVSTFQVTSLVSGVLDTAKSMPIPGGNVADACKRFPYGANIRLWVHKVLNGGTLVAGLNCE